MQTLSETLSMSWQIYKEASPQRLLWETSESFAQ